MKTFEIKITGSGTKNQIECALSEVLRGIQEIEDLDGINWEDPTLFTEISEE